MDAILLRLKKKDLLYIEVQNFSFKNGLTNYRSDPFRQGDLFYEENRFEVKYNYAKIKVN